MESIGIGAEADRADRNAKQAGSRFNEILVEASRLRSLIAGVSLKAASSRGRERQNATVGNGRYCYGPVTFCQKPGLVVRPLAARIQHLFNNPCRSAHGVLPDLTAHHTFDGFLRRKPLRLRFGDPPDQVGASLERLGQPRATAKGLRRRELAVEVLLLGREFCGGLLGAARFAAQRLQCQPRLRRLPPRLALGIALAAFRLALVFGRVALVEPAAIR